MANRLIGVGRSRPSVVVLMLMLSLLVSVSGDSDSSDAIHDGLSTADRAQAAALTQARLTGAPVAVPELTTETTEYTALPSGDMRVSISAGVVRTKRDGQWIPVDLALTRGADGEVTPVAHPYDLRLSSGEADSSTHALASMVVGSERVALWWEGALPEPVLSGERATYVNVLPGVDLVIASTRTGFSQTLVVSDRAAVDQVAKVRLSLTGQGATSFASAPDGGMILADADGTTLARVPALAMWDARTDLAGAPVRTALIATGVEPIDDGVALTLTPDLEWLRDPATVFPVTLDPTVAAASTTFDAYVWENHTGDYSATTDLRLGKLALATGSTEGNITRSYLTWDASALVGKQITAATVSFYSFWSHTCDPRGWKIWTAGAASSATTWDAQPALLSEEAESTATTGGTNCDDAWVSIDGKAFFQRAATAGNSLAPMALTASDETDVTGFKQFRSRDATSTAQVPKAEVTYNAWPTVVSRATSPTTACVTGSERPLVNTLTPTLMATVSDTDATNLDVTFEWWLLGTEAALGSQTVTGVGIGSTASAVVPDGAFIDGGTYQWRVRASDGVADSAVWSSFCEMTVYVIAPPVAGCVGGTPSDFDGDGVRDLVIADPEATVDDHLRAGALSVAYGGGTVASLTEDTANVSNAAGEGEEFGYSIAAFDVNLDGCSDLAVSAPFEDVGAATDAGMVFVLLGSPAGLAAGPASLVWHQDLTAVPDAAETDDWFGFSVAAGQTASGEGYLVIGAPGEDLGSAVDTGLVHYLRGTVNTSLDQSSSGDNETDDRFGYSVTGSPAHIAAGRPGETIDGQAFAGAVSVFSHTPTLVAGLSQGVSGVSETAEAGDQMGVSVSLAVYRSASTASGESALAVGVPGEDLTSNGTTVADAGMVMRFTVLATGATQLADLSRATTDVAGGVGDGDYFGQRVLAVNLAPDEVSTSDTIQLVVGVPGEDDDTVGADTGGVQVFDWRDDPGSTEVSIGHGSGLAGTASAMDLLGLSMIASTEYLYVACPYGEAAVYALSWTDLASGVVSAVATWQAGVNGIPADARAFGAAMS